MKTDVLHHASKQESNGQDGRDKRSGRFGAGNQFGRIRRRPQVPMPPLPPRLQGQGFEAVWKMLCIVAGSCGPGSAAAMKLIVDLSLGRIKPAAMQRQQNATRPGYYDQDEYGYEDDQEGS
jgi:hypothetical protein